VHQGSLVLIYTPEGVDARGENVWSPLNQGSQEKYDIRTSTRELADYYNRPSHKRKAFKLEVLQDDGVTTHLQ
jgi:hypothetical protein